MKYCLVIISLVVSSTLSAQNVKELIEKMNKQYANAKTYSMQINVEVFEEKNATLPFFTIKSEVKKDNKNYYIKTPGQISVATATSVIQIDEENKRIYVQDQKKRNNTQPEYTPETILSDSLLKQHKIKMIGASGNEVKIEMTPYNDPMIERTIIIINTSNNTLSGVEYYYKKNDEITAEKVKIIYNNVKINSTIPAYCFASDTYLHKTKSGFSAAGTWKGFEVINLSDLDVWK